MRSLVYDQTPYIDFLYRSAGLGETNAPSPLARRQLVSHEFGRFSVCKGMSLAARTVTVAWPTRARPRPSSVRRPEQPPLRGRTERQCRVYVSTPQGLLSSSPKCCMTSEDPHDRTHHNHINPLNQVNISIIRKTVVGFPAGSSENNSSGRLDSRVGAGRR